MSEMQTYQNLSFSFENSNWQTKQAFPSKENIKQNEKIPMSKYVGYKRSVPTWVVGIGTYVKSKKKCKGHWGIHIFIFKTRVKRKSMTLGEIQAHGVDIFKNYDGKK